jgi:predicted amidohydrolase
VRVIKCFGGAESARNVQEERAARLIMPVGFTSLRGYPHWQSILNARSYPTNTRHAYTKESLDENTGLPAEIIAMHASRHIAKTCFFIPSPVFIG